MSRILKVSQSDYKVQVNSGGNITLDTGIGLGTVVITGDLEVRGETTTINTTQMTVEDRIITLNSGEQAAGISLIDGYQRSGIEISRGSLSTAQFVFDETIDWYDSVDNVVKIGAFSVQTADGKSNAVKASAIVNGAGSNNLIFDMQGLPGLLRIENTTNYYQRVMDDNDIPNWQTITNYVAAQNGVATVDRLFYPATSSFGNEDSKIQAFATNIETYIAGNIITTVSQVGLTVNNINLFANQITNTSLTNDLALSAITNNVVVDGVLNLTNQALVPATAAGKTKVYSGTVAGGGTGLYSSNTTKSGELVSKQRAVLLSIVL